MYNRYFLKISTNRSWVYHSLEKYHFTWQYVFMGHFIDCSNSHTADFSLWTFSIFTLGTGTGNGSLKGESANNPNINKYHYSFIGLINILYINGRTFVLSSSIGFGETNPLIWRHPFKYFSSQIRNKEGKWTSQLQFPRNHFLHTKEVHHPCPRNPSMEALWLKQCEGRGCLLCLSCLKSASICCLWQPKS